MAITVQNRLCRLVQSSANSSLETCPLRGDKSLARRLSRCLCLKGRTRALFRTASGNPKRPREYVCTFDNNHRQSLLSAPTSWFQTSFHVGTPARRPSSKPNVKLPEVFSLKSSKLCRKRLAVTGWPAPHHCARVT